MTATVHIDCAPFLHKPLVPAELRFAVQPKLDTATIGIPSRSKLASMELGDFFQLLFGIIATVLAVAAIACNAKRIQSQPTT